MHDVRASFIPTVKGEVAGTTAIANLLVYMNDAVRKEWILERTEALAQRLPARSLILDATRAPSSDELVPVPLTVTRAEIPVGQLAAETVLALVKPSLGRTLPTCLWWCTSEEAHDTLLLILAEHVEHLVVDSSTALHDAEALADLSHVYARLPRLSLRDLAWMRTAQWRDAVASIFHETTAVAELPRIIRVEITADRESEAMYLIGWLASRLGWSAVADRRFIDQQGGAVNIFLLEGESRASHISAIRMRSASAEFTAQMTGNSEAIVGTYSVNGLTVKQHVMPYLPVDTAQLVEQALLRPGTDELFEAALRIIRDLGSLHD
jgi:glucose-6-phosphate dehydrogenase assembly protein OpcA